MKKVLVAVKWVVIACVCILLAFGIEKHRSAGQECVLKDYELSEIEHPGFEYVDGKLTTSQGVAQIILPVDGCAQTLQLDYETVGWVSATWSTEDEPSLANIDTTNAWLIDYRSGSLSKVIETDTNQLVVSFFGLDSTVTINAVSLTNTAQFQMNRFVFYAAVLMAVAFVLAGLKSLREHPERIVASVCVLLGVGMLVIVPYEKCSWDDETHFSNAYKLSYALEGKDTQWTQAAENFVNIKLPFSYSYQERMNMEQYLDELGEINTSVEENEGISGIIGSIDAFPTAIGILIGRASGAPFHIWFAWAKLANLILYAILIYFAVKFVPTGKSLMSFLALLPTPLYLTVTYSTDYFINGFMFLGIAVFLREFFEKNEKLTYKNIFLFAVSMFLACIKKTIYIPLILIGLILPKEKYKDKKQKIIYYVILVSCCVLSLAAVAVNATDLSDARGGDTSVSRQMDHILQNPISFGIMLAKSIIRTSVSYIFNGEAKLNFNIFGRCSESTEMIVVIMLVILIICAKGQDKTYEVGWKSAIKTYVLIGIVVCFIWGSMYLAFTPVGAQTISGVQPRYYTAFLPLLFIMLPVNRIKCYISEKYMMPFSLIVVTGVNFWCIKSLLLLR